MNRIKAQKAKETHINTETCTFAYTEIPHQQKTGKHDI